MILVLMADADHVPQGEWSTLPRTHMQDMKYGFAIFLTLGSDSYPIGRPLTSVTKVNFPLGCGQSF